MRCKTSDGWYASATTFEIGTKDRKKYLLKVESDQVRKCRCEIDVETGVWRGGEGD